MEASETKGDVEYAVYQWWVRKGMDHNVMSMQGLRHEGEPSSYRYSV
jgi:hypothetical protein